MIRCVAVVFVSLSMMSSAVLAQIIGDVRCKDPIYTAKAVDQIRSALARVVDAVETVPPDEAEYIQSESKKALEQQNGARFNAVAARRYYPAFKFHADAKIAFQNLDAAKQALSRDLARYLVVVLSRIGELQERMPAYLSADQKRAQPMVNDEIRSNMYYFLPSTKALTVSLLQCVVSVL
jgi:hypothetical protein